MNGVLYVIAVLYKFDQVTNTHSLKRLLFKGLGVESVCEEEKIKGAEAKFTDSFYLDIGTYFTVVQNSTFPKPALRL